MGNKYRHWGALRHKNGPVRGAHSDSFRAEAYRMLATLCFFTRLAQYTGVVEPWTGEVATDSQSLLDAISFKPFTTEFPVFAHNGRVLKDVASIDVQSPEWDLVSMILRVLSDLPQDYISNTDLPQDYISNT
jgi:hypothetical protein